MNYEEIVKQCRELRQAFERDEAKFLIALVHVKRTSMDLLRENGCSTFGQFLNSHHLCDVGRYERFASGLKLVGEDAALRIGAEAVCKSAHATTPQAVTKFVAAAEAFVAQEGVAPRGQTVTRMLSNVDPQARTPNVVKIADETARLRAENEQLRADLAAAKATIKKQAKLLDAQATTIERLKERAA